MLLGLFEVFIFLDFIMSAPDEDYKNGGGDYPTQSEKKPKTEYNEDSDRQDRKRRERSRDPDRRRESRDRDRGRVNRNRDQRKKSPSRKRYCV